LGKPDPNMLTGVQSRYGVRPDEVAMVGDRIYTDIEMAFNAGAFGVLVLSGETTLDIADQAPRQPDLIADSIEVLGELLVQSREK
jgi:NagD protein